MVLSDREVIATFMEPSPCRQRGRGRDSKLGWWRFCGIPAKWEVIDFGWKGDSLDALRTVEARLTEEQWAVYDGHMLSILSPGVREYDEVDWRQLCLHASAEQKILGLAATLRSYIV